MQGRTPGQIRRGPLQSINLKAFDNQAIRDHSFYFLAKIFKKCFKILETEHPRFSKYVAYSSHLLTSGAPRPRNLKREPWIKKGTLVSCLHQNGSFPCIQFPTNRSTEGRCIFPEIIATTKILRRWKNLGCQPAMASSFSPFQVSLF